MFKQLFLLFKRRYQTGSRPFSKVIYLSPIIPKGILIYVSPLSRLVGLTLWWYVRERK